MDIIPMLLKEMGEEAQTTRKFLERVPNDKFDWQPHPPDPSSYPGQHTPVPLPLPSSRQPKSDGHVPTVQGSTQYMFVPSLAH